MESHSWTATEYKFGFVGQEKDDDVNSRKNLLV
jgi:hypothetical protein